VRVRVIFLLAVFLLCASFTFAAAERSVQKRSAKTSSTKKGQVKKAAARRKKPRKASPVRLRRIRRAFVASNDLKPMARQLFESRSPAAYAGVEAYARRHAKDDAGALADLALGYAHILDHDGAKAVAPLLRARARAGDLADYVTYFLGDAQQAAGQSNEALATLRDFGDKYPDSVFTRQAALVCANALVATGDPAAAVAIIQKHRLPTRSDVELALGRALLRSGDTSAAADVLRHLYYSMPLSSEADDAGALLQFSAGGLGGNLALEQTRAELLARGGRFRDAAKEYRALLALAGDADRPAIEVDLAGALHRAGDDRQARGILEHMAAPSGELGAERWYYLLEIARSADDADAVASALAQLRDAGPTSSWLEQGLLSAGNFFLLRNDYDRATDFYREIHERFPQGRLAPYAHWKSAWLSLRQGRPEEARRGFEEQIALYPSSAEVPAAMYWRARLAEEDEHDPAKARAYYSALEQRFRNYYYADLARQRLKALRATGVAAVEPVLEKIPPLRHSGDFSDVAVPADNLRAQKARLLQNGGMTDLAVRELRAADEGGEAWVTAEIARLYRDNGVYHRALETLKRAVPAYFAMDMDELPRPWWEDLFPRPYWADLKRYASLNGLDPFLVASLIRQESEFNAAAISRANAVGLMQVLPATGRSVAREVRLRRYSSQQLLLPGVNLQLGTRFFRHMVDHYNGKLEYALAAYNAGTNRVDAWLAGGKFRDPQEFVESIPFTETREYVQAILRNATVYRQLYGTP
jgi:soluble lytic murein transglycosylase